mmetsp:Transcript_21508/g.22237  ORF Transcript_21508/g.22237 Transcript_21508/m.22237 type:complete len:593 (+) Transcript_21508:119-1897(+)
MDELQSHVDDAIFVDAVQNSVPCPTKNWKFPSPDEVDSYVNKLTTQNPQALELEGVCSNCLGFYLFTSYLKTIGKDLFGSFLIDVAIYKRCRLGSVAVSIIEKYFTNTSARKRQQDPPANLFRQKSSIATDSIDWKQYMDLENANNSLKLIGPPLEKIVVTFKQISEQSEVALESEINEFLYDELETIIFGYVKSNHFISFRVSSFFAEYLNFVILSEKPLSVDDFTLFRVLGRGGFGVVNGCKHSHTGKLYAMKVMERRRIKSLKAETLCIAERQTMVMLDTPFIVGLKYAFTTPTELYLILDLMLGGDLGYALFRRRSFSIEEVKYYTVRTLLGLKALHDLSIVFRDLKPDNILMDGKGRTKLSDLGLAVRVPRNGLTGACGTRGYWAPEMLKRDPSGYRIRYNLSVDWFSFGCLVYEFMTGVCPFRTEVARNWGGFGKKDKEKAIDLAVQEMEPFFDSEIFDPTTQDLVSKLLIKDGKTRLGANGAGEVMAHAYFDDINWEEYIYDLVPPPCLPRKDLNVASQSEIGYFGDDANARRLELTEADLELFAKWDYIRPSAFLEEVVQFMQYEELKGPIRVLSPTSSCCMIS